MKTGKANLLSKKIYCFDKKAFEYLIMSAQFSLERILKIRTTYRNFFLENWCSVLVDH